MERELPNSNGYTLIPTSVVDALTQTLTSPAQWYIVMLIMRLTYGTDEEWYRNGNSFIASYLGRSKRNVRKHLKSLIYRNVIISCGEPGDIKLLKVNEDVEQWIKRKRGQTAAYETLTK